ncbi:MAG TPA: hypothetical protein VKR82_03765 [Candidatus Acidoferrales bacterium]|nr:hypothetical protein [Candidatus Acidoferrales bacterium]
MCLPGLLLASGVGWSSIHPQTPSPSPKTLEAEFSATVASMSDAPPDDPSSIQKLLEKAAGILDSAVIGGLAETADSQVDQINQRLAKFVSHESGIGERYRLMSLSAQPRLYALVADFGLGAPSAIRLYAQKNNEKRYTLVARVDRFTQQDFLDDSLELVPIARAPVVFVTVAGRTDDLRTGVFTAWQFDEKGLTQLWTSDMVQQSSYQGNSAGFQLTYCRDPDETNPRICNAMIRESYRWQDGKWSKVDSVPVSVPKR